MGKSSRSKDPNKPKRATTAFFAYANEIRNAVREEHPTAKMGDVSKIIGERWRAMDSEEKAPYLAIAAEDKERYDREMENYEPPEDLDDDDDDQPQRKKKKKDPNAPKRASSAYLFFSNDVRPEVRREHPDLSMGELSKIIGARWRGMGAEDKEQYEDKANEDKERYPREMEEYRNGE